MLESTNLSKPVMSLHPEHCGNDYPGRLMIIILFIIDMGFMRRKVRRALILLLIASAAVSGNVATAAADPIPDPIVKSGLAVQIEDFVQIPPSSGSPPLARILLLKHSGDNTGRLFVNDILGTLYVIDGSTITTYLDLASLHPNFYNISNFSNGFISFAFHPDFSTNGIFYTAHTEDPNSLPPPPGPDMVSSSPEPSTAVHNVIKEWILPVWKNPSVWSPCPSSSLIMYT